MAVRLHTTLDASEPVRRGNFSHVLDSPAAMADRFAEYPEAVAETERLADAAAVRSAQRPRVPLPGSRGRAGDAQADRAVHGPAGGPLRERAGEIRERADVLASEQELRIIESAATCPASSCCTTTCSSWPARWRSRCAAPAAPAALLPPGRGRGSSVSSIVCYLTGLSHVDPIANELLIGRFLNDELTSLPDIDLDFPRDIREQLIPRVHERYGHDRSALVAAFPTYRARGAIRELGKALGLPPGEIERVARGSEGWDARDVGKDIESARAPGATPTRGRWAGSRGWPPRRTGCRATCPSTRAG